MRRVLLAVLMLAVACLPSEAIDLPRDIVNTELAISFHKQQIRLLNDRIVQTELMRQQQTENTKKTAKLDRVLDSLHVRERGIMNWLYFADNLNTIRLNFVKIYDLETEILDMVRDWGLTTPDVDVKSLRGIKATYRDLGAKVAVIMLGYDSQVNFVRKTKALARLFAAQFGGEVMDNTFSGKMKNLTVNMGTDLQRRTFTNHVLSLQYDIIHDLSKKKELMRYTVLGYYKFDLIGGALDFLESAAYYQTKAFKVEQTFYDNSYN